MKKKFYIFISFFCVLFFFSITVLNAEHYPLGIEGIKAGSLPPAGKYLKVYNQYYKTSKILTHTGDRIPVSPTKITSFASAFRLLYVSNYEILGAAYAADIIIPFVNLDINFANYDYNVFGLSDITVEPFALGWHKKNYDVTAAAGYTFRTGPYDEIRPFAPSKGYNTILLTAGGTYYPDKEKKWSLSALSRYEIHDSLKSSDTKYGQNYFIEWGIGNQFSKTLDLGISGYCQWQTSKDKGNTVSVYKDKVYAAGPEFTKVFPDSKLILSCKMLFEFGVKSRAQGNTAVVSLTRIF
ncbi:transporter [Candidatus Dependentiae bacterium]|nr:transporter [Candidatus Dependentiae bacterium]